VLPEILVQAGNSSTCLDFSITQSVYGMQEHASLYYVGMSTVKKSTFHLCHIHLSVHSFTHIIMTSSGSIFVKFYIGALFNICEESWNLINIGQKYWALHMKV
jgi:hypothetical protein